MKEKSKNPSVKKKDSTTAGKGGVEIEPSENSGGDNPDDMSADEMAAFQKIMGEIEDQEVDKLNGSAQSVQTEEKDRLSLTDGDPANHNDLIEVTDNEEDTGVDAHGSSDEKNSLSEEDADASLDEDQQKAFESIMAQIEGNGNHDTAPEEQQGQQAEQETTDDFAAELEKVANAAKTIESQPSAGKAGHGSPDEDTQKADEPKSDAIIVGDMDPSPPDSAFSASTDPEAVNASVDQGATEAGHASDPADEESQDISDDIDDILKEITMSDEESDLQETIDDDIVVQPAKTPDQEQENALETSPPPDEKEHPVALEAEPTIDAPPGHQVVETLSASPLNAPQDTEPLRETTVSTGGSKKKKIVIASAVVILMIGLTGYYFWPPNSWVDSMAPLPVQTSSSLTEAIEKAPAALPQEPSIVDKGPSDGSRLKTMADTLDRLRNEVIAKQAEIQELRAYYQAGIDAEIQGIVDTVRKANQNEFTLSDAMAEPRISLGLAAIQRRDTYISRLEAPVNTLFLNSEELLYLSRKAGLLAMMAVRTSDIDIDGFIQQANEISNMHRRTLAQLDIDDVPATPPTLKSIWQDIDQRLPARPDKPEKKNDVTITDNVAVWKEICDGDYSGKHKLTALSPQAARCIAKWKGKDLFLNAVTDLSAEAARGLADWEGDWLGLNGLNELTPEAAVHLARWKGKGLSLNGLSRLSPRVVAILSEWQGDQIELVHVKHMAHWENPNTRLFLSEDLKRKHNATRK